MEGLPVKFWGLDPLYWAHVKLFVVDVLKLPQYPGFKGLGILVPQLPGYVNLGLVLSLGFCTQFVSLILNRAIISRCVRYRKPSDCQSSCYGLCCQRGQKAKIDYLSRLDNVLYSQKRRAIHNAFFH